MFIELTSRVGKITFNINHVSDFQGGVTNDGCNLIMSDGNRVEVEESYEQVKELIKNEVAAERGY